jgi:hypothetical protein
MEFAMADEYYSLLECFEMLANVTPEEFFGPAVTLERSGASGLVQGSRRVQQGLNGLSGRPLATAANGLLSSGRLEVFGEAVI